MSVRLSVLCGALFAFAALVAGAATVADAPERAMRDLRLRMTACALPGLRCAPPNVFLHQREPGAPTPAFGRPDPLMLVSSAWVDLSGGPVRLDIPATGTRFFAVQVIDARDDTIALADAASIGRDGARLSLGGPGATGEGTNIGSTTGWVWIVARFAVADDADLPAVHDLQAALKISRR